MLSEEVNVFNSKQGEALESSRLFCRFCRVIHAAACPTERVSAQSAALLRVSRELRQLLSDVPSDDDDARSLLRDCGELEHVGNDLLNWKSL